MHQNTTLWRPKWRAAIRIHEHLRARDAVVDQLHPPRDIWQELNATAERLQYVLARGWHIAGQKVLEDLVYVTRQLERELEAFRQRLPSTLRGSITSTPGGIVAELCAVEAEFDDVELNSDERSISVMIGPIELEGVYLGAFRVTLHWERIGRGRAYVVEALDPNPAEGTEDVTHPHVRDGLLCEGEGTAPIKCALAQGRFFDFFMLVRQILETYNSESAHVALDRWDGVNCRDCGSRMSREEQGTCERCNEPLCSDCSLHCQACDSYPCSRCSSACDTCGSYFCEGCLDTFAGQTLCPNCLEAQKENEDEPEDTSETDDPATMSERQERHATAAPALHALCVGQAAVSA